MLTFQQNIITSYLLSPHPWGKRAGWGWLSLRGAQRRGNPV